jgi:hypothetical protein
MILLCVVLISIVCLALTYIQTWALWRKHMAFASISFFVLLSNYSLSAMTPGLSRVIQDFDITVTQASYLVTLQILFLGIGVSSKSLVSTLVMLILYLARIYSGSQCH